MKKELIGYVGVDSGQLMIVDPCYIDSHWKHEGSDGNSGADEDFSYNGACQATLSDEGYGELSIGATAAVVFRSGYGDGTYPVYTYKNKDNRIVRIEVIME